MSPPAPIYYMEADGGKILNIALLTFKSERDGLLGTHIPIFPGRDIFVGRDEDLCSPSIRNSIVSRVHFRIYSVIYDDDLITEFPPLIYCEDRQSSNGTYVNNTLIGTLSSPRSPYLLDNGDVIGIRPYWTFNFHQKHTSGRYLDDLQTQEVKLFKDRYTISSRLLGSGIYGSVYLANDIMAQRQLACKVVDLRRYTPESDGYGMPLDGAHKVGVQAYVERYRGITEARKKLMREIEILGKLNHPNIATVFKAFCTPHSLYIFNELAAGGDLFSFLQSNGSCLEDLHARVISRQVAIAVDYLHSNGIAHRDLKPENILVMRTGIGHRVVLTDFGCAGYIGNSLGRMKSTVGTYDYVAPEVHRPDSKGYTEAIDMWSMGIITLCLLTGDAFISFDELHVMSQADIALKLATANYHYPQWRHLNCHGKDFIKRLLVLEPLKRMTAKEAVSHDWFQKPARIAMELDKLYERATAFWSRRTNTTGVVEDLPDIIRTEGWQSIMRGNARQKLAHKRIPDASSPYFSLERHLQPPGARSKSSLNSKRKRILAELKESDSPFIAATMQSEYDYATKIVGPKTSFPLYRKESAIGMSNTLLRPQEPCSTRTAIEISPATNQGQVTGTEKRRRKSITSDGSETNMIELQRAIIEGIKCRETVMASVVSANTPECRKFSAVTGPSIRHVDANDLFGTPIEIKAAEAAEAAHKHYTRSYSKVLHVFKAEESKLTSQRDQ